MVTFPVVYMNFLQKEQLESIAAVIYTEVAMYKAPKESFKILYPRK